MFHRAGGLYGGAGGISLAKCSPDPAPPGNSREFQAPSLVPLANARKMCPPIFRAFALQIYLAMAAGKLVPVV